MSVRELEHLATSPSRIERQASKSNETFWDPSIQWSFVPQCPEDGLTLAIHGLELVPGGKYLVTFTKFKGIYLWDLGYNAAIPFKAIPVAHVAIKTDFSWWPICLTENGRGIEVQVCCFQYVVYSPVLPSPEY
jgi:hypothetical protein